MRGGAAADTLAARAGNKLVDDDATIAAEEYEKLGANPFIFFSSNYIFLRNRNQMVEEIYKALLYTFELSELTLTSLTSRARSRH